MIDTDIFVKILRIGPMKNANLPSVSQRKPVLNTFLGLLSKPKTTEQVHAETQRFVVKGLTIGLIGVLLLFAYSVVFTEQPLFNEAPTDKAIFAVLTLLAGQSLQILANFLSKSPPPMATKCPPLPTIKQEEKLIQAITPQKSFSFGNPNEREAK
jgi:hypothetical protein